MRRLLIFPAVLALIFGTSACDIFQKDSKSHNSGDNSTALNASPENQDKMPQAHRMLGQKLLLTDVDRNNPVYETFFENEDALSDWHMEGGKSASLVDGKLVLESVSYTSLSTDTDNHLVYWLNKELPSDFLLEFSVRPQNRQQGLNIVFFNARGVDGSGIFEPSIKPRNGLFKQYHSGDLNNYHISYWAGKRSTANVRKNHGFHLVAVGKDLVSTGPANSFQTIQLYKRGGTIRLIVDDVLAVAFDDDGKTYGPVWNHSGWIGLRQMAHTVRCEYDYVRIFSLLKNVEQ